MIFRWILSHSVIILVLIAILFAVWKVDDLHSWLPQVVTRDAADSHSADVTADVADDDQMKASKEADIPEVDGTNESDHESVAAPTDEEASENKGTHELTQSGSGKDSTEAEMAPQVTVDAENNDTNGTGQSQQQMKDPESGSNDKATPVIASTKPDKGGDSSSSAASANTEKSVKPHVQDKNEPEVMPVDVASLSEQWLSARQAYWQQDMKQAETQYRALRELSPKDPDIVGELGNLYYARGDLQRAVKTYYEAGLLLQDAGRVREAWMLADDMHRLDASKSNELRKQLEAHGAGH